MRILLVEDEEKLAKTIKTILKNKGYAVDHLTDGIEAQKRIALCFDDYDLIILDLSLPSKNGLEVCKETRNANISTPILVLTADDKLNSKVSLFEAGADDYLVKPFAFEELLSRINAITRRPKQTLPTEIKVADVILNPNTLKVFRADKEIKFTLREFRILEYLMRNPNVALSRENITSSIWDFDYDSFSNVLDVFINKIRSKIDSERPQKLIETVRGVGYKFHNR